MATTQFNPCMMATLHCYTSNHRNSSFLQARPDASPQLTSIDSRTSVDCGERVWLTGNGAKYGGGPQRVNDGGILGQNQQKSPVSKRAERCAIQGSKVK